MSSVAVVWKWSLKDVFHGSVSVIHTCHYFCGHFLLLFFSYVASLLAGHMMSSFLILPAEL